MGNRSFSRRTFTLGTFVALLCDILAHRADLRTAARGGRVDRRFAEKIMLAVTRVNGCRWCNYGHTRAALAAGVSETELQQLMAGELGAFPESEAVALAFAQHYAESRDHPDPAAWQRVVDYYGSDTACDILTYIRLITFGNLYGNTFDAFLARLQGRASLASTLRDELLLVVLPLVAMLLVSGTVLDGLVRLAF